MQGAEIRAQAHWADPAAKGYRRQNLADDIKAEDHAIA